MEERVLRLGKFTWFCKVFGGKYIGIGSGKEGCSFIVGLVGAFSRGSGFSSGDCKCGIAGFREG